LVPLDVPLLDPLLLPLPPLDAPPLLLLPLLPPLLLPLLEPNPLDVLLEPQAGMSESASSEATPAAPR
jgi:hypothetical protein